MNNRLALFIIAIAYLSLSLHANSQQEWLRSSLCEKQCMQKSLVKIRNISLAASTIALIIICWPNNPCLRSTISHISMKTTKDPRPTPKIIENILKFATPIAALNLIWSIPTSIVSILYGIYNNTQLEELKSKLDKNYLEG